MAIRDQAAMERSLDNDYGATAGPHAPASFQVALFDGDPSVEGVELRTLNDDNEPTNYSRVTIFQEDFGPAEEGVKALLEPVTFPAPAAEWDTATHWGLYDPVEGLWWDCAPFQDPLEVTAASNKGPVVSLAIFYDDNTEDDL